jgi:hypothetical protein
MSDKARKAASAAGRYKKENMKCNKPQRAPKGDKHKYVVKACQGGEEKIVRFGARGYEDYLQHKDEGSGWWACNYNW